MSPTLFDCFINDLHECFYFTCDHLVLEESQVSSLSFVDDLVILSSTHKGLQNALNKLETYCFDWQLTVNIKKTSDDFRIHILLLLHFFIITNYYLEVEEYNFFGKIINFKGSFKTSIQELRKKGLKALFALKSRFSNFQTLPVNFLIF